ncbi:uncharacterized protein LOC107263092 [Cephus cinctus]|uniref:Uncharacterized protein LOC107263092 n=1 Tax=Cephus cinctus TaxID=211228 RepID=A0AAJ7BGI4_CEPCN|nr:uncharacterized protein LOC107263092 [Cephus cinctus]
MELSSRIYIPTQSDVRTNLGSPLAQIIFDYSHEEIRKLLGIIPPLEGPPKILWKSPSDQLIGKVALTPPLTNKFIKACTHQGILALGQVVLEKFEADMDERMKRHMKEELEEVQNMFEAEKRRIIELTIHDVSLQYENYIDILQEEFKTELKNSISDAITNCNKAMQKAVVHERMNVTHEMLKKLRDEIAHVIETLYINFEQSLRAQKENMIADFNEIMRKERARMDEKMKDFENQKIKALLILRHRLQMQNAIDLAYVLCIERMHCIAEKKVMHKCFKIQIRALEELLLDLNEVIRSMKNEEQNKIDNGPAWEKKVYEIVRQFQKFINFAFGAVPGQAEFLLSLESLLLPELDEKISKREESQKQFTDITSGTEKKQHFHIVEIIDDDGCKWKPIQLIPDLPDKYCTEEHFVTPIVKSSIDFYNDDEYADNISKKSSTTTDSNESLPFCYVGGTLYVRSDYRGDIDQAEKKTMLDLAEGSRFIMELKKPQRCIQQPIDNLEKGTSLSHTNLSTNANQKSHHDELMESETPKRPNFPICQKKTERNQNKTIKPVVDYKPRIQSLIHASKRTSKSCIGKKENSEIRSKLETQKKNTESIKDIVKRPCMCNNVTVNRKDVDDMFKTVSKHDVEHLQTVRQFTCERMCSLMRIFRLYPSLQRMIVPKSGQALY